MHYFSVQMQAAFTPNYKLLYEQQLAKNNELQLTLAGLQQQLSQLQKMIFGSRHERFVAAEANPAQLSLQIQAESVESCSVVQAKQITYTKINTTTEKSFMHPGRMKLPEHLRREEITIEPSEDIGELKKIGDEVSEVLEWQPGELYVKRYVRPKYARPNGEGVIIAELPARTLPKAMAGAGLLAQIVIDKYIDHLPLHRQMQRFERSSVRLPYSTLTEWVSATCTLIAPLYEALKNEVLRSNYLHADETPIKVLDKDKKGHTHRGYFWIYQNSLEKLVFFDYQMGRGREGPEGILKNFRGYLQTDGYVAYESFKGRKDVTLLHCMAHARRKFHEALGNDEKRASYALERIGDLYSIERACNEQGLDDAGIEKIRGEKSVPIIKSLGEWMKDQYVQVLPKSAIGQALAYTIERWDRLSAYTTSGMLLIDNNPVENAIRPVAVGRKNYLFCGSHEAAQRSAMLYSLLGTCKLHSIEPYHWLKTILEKIADHPINKISELLPHHFNK